jgi:hypothetical protein
MDQTGKRTNRKTVGEVSTYVSEHMDERTDGCFVSLNISGFIFVLSFSRLRVEFTLKMATGIFAETSGNSEHSTGFIPERPSYKFSIWRNFDLFITHQLHMRDVFLPPQVQRTLWPPVGNEVVTGHEYVKEAVGFPDQRTVTTCENKSSIFF